MKATAENERVRRRRVYYLSGFDPRGPAYYHRLYREEAAKQAALHQARIEVGQRQRRADGQQSWNIEAEWDGQPVSTEYLFLRWDDIVRRHWESNPWRLLQRCGAGYADYIRCGAFSRLRQSFRGPALSALYPPAYLLLLIALALAGAWGAGTALGGLPGWLAGLALGAAVLGGGLRLGSRLGVFWLLRTYLFVYSWGTRHPDALAQRAEQFCRRILADQEREPCDEVLLIGHSVGTLVAVEVAARLAQAMPEAMQPRFTLVTLGQCIPLLSFIPQADAFRARLQMLGQARLRWLDMNARADSLCYAQANPLQVSGIPSTGQPTPQVVRPFRMFDARDYARIKRNKLRLHFQYIMASALPNEYDYFRITAGPRRLQAF